MPEEKKRPDKQCCSRAEKLVLDDEVQEVIENELAPILYQIMFALSTLATSGILVKSDERKILDRNLGFLYHDVMKEHDKTCRSRMTITGESTSRAELEGHPWSSMKNECLSCLTFHIKEGQEYECIEFRGPLIIENLDRYSFKRWGYSAMIIGINAMLYLPKHLNEIYLNLGVVYKKEEDSLMSLEDIRKMIESRMKILAADSNLPILVEFPINPTHPTIDKLKFFLHAIAHLQQRYAGPIILIIPPYIPLKYEGYDDYTTKKIMMEYIYRRALMWGQNLGAAVAKLHMQTDHLGDRIIMMGPRWSSEAIFNREGQRTREYYYRLVMSLEKIVAASKKWNITVHQRNRMTTSSNLTDPGPSRHVHM